MQRDSGEEELAGCEAVFSRQLRKPLVRTALFDIAEDHQTQRVSHVFTRYISYTLFAAGTAIHDYPSMHAKQKEAEKAI